MGREEKKGTKLFLERGKGVPNKRGVGALEKGCFRVGKGFKKKEKGAFYEEQVYDHLSADKGGKNFGRGGKKNFRGGAGGGGERQGSPSCSRREQKGGKRGVPVFAPEKKGKLPHSLREGKKEGMTLYFREKRGKGEEPFLLVRGTERDLPI